MSPEGTEQPLVAVWWVMCEMLSIHDVVVGGGGDYDDDDDV